MKTLLTIALVFTLTAFASDPAKPLKPHNDGIWKIRFSPGGEHFLTAGGDGVVKVWWSECFCGLAGFNHDKEFKVYDADFFPDQRIISTSLDASIYIWGSETGEKIHKVEGHSEYASHVRVSNDGSRFYTGGADDVVKIWDSKTFELVNSIKTKSPDGMVAFGKSLSNLLTIGMDGVIFWDVENQVAEKTLTESPYYFALEPINDTLVLMGGNAGEGAPLQIVDIEKKEVVQTFEKVPGFFWQLAAAKNGEWVAASAYNGPVYIWERATGKLIYTTDQKIGGTLSVAFFPEGRAVLVGTADGRLQMVRF